MNRKPGDEAAATVLVAVPIEIAFRAFTEEIDLWWRRGLKFRMSRGDRGIVHLEPREGGRLFESYEVDGQTRVNESGKVVVWEPPTRLVFSWRAANFAPGESTEVEVTFAPSASGTLVTVRHRGWSAIRPDHPARHGEDVPRFIGNMARWWGDLLTNLREHLAQPR